MKIILRNHAISSHSATNPLSSNFFYLLLTSSNYWPSPHLFVTLKKLLSLDNSKKNEFSFGIVLAYS